MNRLLLFLCLLLFAVPAYAQFQGSVALQPYKYNYASNVTVNTIKASSGFLHTITYESGSTSPIIVYDSNVVAGDVPTAQMASLPTVAGTYFFDVTFTSGCTVTTNGNVQYTVAYL